MIKTRPLLETPEEHRRRQVEEFHARYPHPFIAWAERESQVWRIALDPNLTPETKAILICGAFGGQTLKVPKMSVLWGYYFRAAWWCLAFKEKSGRSWDDFTAESLAADFELTQGRYRRLIKHEEQWQRRQALRPEKELMGIRYRPDGGMLSAVLPTLTRLPAVDELLERLLTLPTKQ